MSYELIWEPEGVVVYCYDVMTWEDVVNYKQELFSDPRFVHVRYQIFDGRDITKLEVMENDAVKAAQLDNALGTANKSCKIATVTSEELNQRVAGFYGLALTVPSWTFATFVDMDLARNWVDID